MKYFSLLTVLVVVLLISSCVRETESEMSNQESSQWPDSLDAVVAAPASHNIMLENEQVRVLEVIVRPGEKEPMHHHKWPSIMIVDKPSLIRYFGSDGKLRFEPPPGPPPPENIPLEPRWFEAEPLHAVENIGDQTFHAIRIELKSN